MLRIFPMTTQPTAPAARRGVLNIELLVAALVLGMAMALLLPGLKAAARVREERQFEVLARIELNNLRSAAEATRGAVTADANTGNEGSTSQLSPWFRARYPDADLSRSVESGSEQWPGGDGVRLSISRPAVDRGRTAPVSLVFWPGSGRLSGGLP